MASQQEPARCRSTQIVDTPKDLKAWWRFLKGVWNSGHWGKLVLLIIVIGSALWLTILPHKLSEANDRISAQDREIAGLRFQNQNLITSNQGILLQVDPIRRAYPDLSLVAALAQAQTDIESLRNEVGRDRFKPFSAEVRAEFINRLTQFQNTRPASLTNLQISLDTSNADRKLFLMEIHSCLSESKCGANLEGGTILGGPSETTVLYRDEFEASAVKLVNALGAITKTPISRRVIQGKHQVALFIRPDLLFEKDGTVDFR